MEEAVATDRVVGVRGACRHPDAFGVVREVVVEDQIGVGYRGALAATAITRGARFGAGALRSDAKRAARVHRGDAAAAGADFENVDHRDLHRQRVIVAADERSAGGEYLAAIDHAGLRGGSAHVEGDGVLEPEFAAQRLCADDPGRRPGFEHAHALRLRLARFVETARGLNQHEGALEAGVLQMAVDAGDIVAHPRADIGVRNGRRTALEFAVFLRQFVRGADEGARQTLLHDRSHP